MTESESFTRWCDAGYPMPGRVVEGPDVPFVEQGANDSPPDWLSVTHGGEHGGWCAIDGDFDQTKSWDWSHYVHVPEGHTVVTLSAGDGSLLGGMLNTESITETLTQDELALLRRLRGVTT